MCQVCKKPEWKYKCPKCVIRYCSVDCYKSHECSLATQKPPDQPLKRVSKALQLDSDDESDLLTTSQLQSLDSKTVSNLLGKMEIYGNNRLVFCNRSHLMDL